MTPPLPTPTPTTPPKEKNVRIQITLPKSVLAYLDAAARQFFGKSRSEAAIDSIVTAFGPEYLRHSRAWKRLKKERQLKERLEQPLHR